MKFLDLNGLKHLLKFMDRTVSVVSGNFQINRQGRYDIPFITNHQIISNNSSSNINVFNWFKGASEGGILEIVSTGSLGGSIYCIDDTSTSMMYKMEELHPNPPILNKCNSLTLSYNTYARLIKLDGKLIVACFIKNQ